MAKADAVLERLRSASSLSIICHDEPDPDAISSAIALEVLAKENGVERVDILHGGTVSHHQNRVFVNAFDIDLQPYSVDVVQANDLLAFVDHSIPGDRNPVPNDIVVDIVIDHHPSDQLVEAAETDIREEYGATATILAEYFRDSAVEITPRIASALLFGIHRERLDFYRQPTTIEYETARYLHARAAPEMLRELYGATFTSPTVDAFGRAIFNRTRRESRLVSGVGRVENQVAIAQAADFLLNIDGIDIVLVCGIVRDEIHLSARTIRSDIDLGARLDHAFEDVGSAGGHRTMAGGQLPLDAFQHPTDGVHRFNWLQHRIADRFFVATADEGAELEA